MPVPLNISVAGSGVAAAVSGLLAARAGHQVQAEVAGHPLERIVAAPRATVELIEELTGICIPRALPSRWLRARRVAWEKPHFSSVAHETLVFDAQALAGIVASRIDTARPARTGAREKMGRGWKLLAGGRSANPGRITAGGRRAAAGWVDALAGVDGCEMLVACVPHGWLAACPHPDGGISLASVHPAHLQLVTQDALEQAVDHLWPGRGRKVEMRGSRWIAVAPSFQPGCASDTHLDVGESAVTFDPILGDGTGHAVRGALLATSVMEAIAAGANERDCLAHYRSRLAHAFAQHVRNSATHYAGAWNAAVWREEIAWMHACAAATPFLEPLALRLQGRELFHTDS